MTSLVAQPEPKLGPYTWDDFVALDEGDRRELFDGQLLEAEVPSCAHEFIVALLVEALGVWRRANEKGRVAGSGLKVRISERRGVMPDVQLITGPGRPALAVEVISPSSRKYDRVVKLEYYASIATPEYWIVDPEASTLERLVLHEGRYLIADSLAGDAVFRPASFEALVLPLAELWQAAAEGAAIDLAERRAARAKKKPRPATRPRRSR